MTAYLTNAKQILQRLKHTLENRYYVDSIGLFGSIVRDDFSPDSSDVDIIVSFTKPVGIEFIDLSNFLEKEFDRRVDIVSRKGIKDKYFKAIEKDIVYV